MTIKSVPDRWEWKDLQNNFPGIRRYTNSRKPTAHDKAIGQRIRWCRELSGLKLEELAEEISISYQQLARYETGSNKIDASRLKLIAEFFNISALDQDFPFEVELRKIDLSVEDLLQDRIVVRLLRAWHRIKHQGRRDILFQFIKSYDPDDAAQPKDNLQPS
jgi:transcriptional regulator with XRE-family HTH domain